MLGDQVRSRVHKFLERRRVGDESLFRVRAATMIRGLLAVVAGRGVLFIPEMASTILLLPFAVAISILLRAAYGTIDSAIDLDWQQ